MTRARRGLGGIVFSLIVGATSEASAVEASDLVGFWRHQRDGRTVELRAADGANMQGRLVVVPDVATAIGYRVGDTVIRRLRVTGTRIEFETTVRSSSPEESSHCPPTSAIFGGTITADLATIDGTIANVGYEALRDHGNRIVRCVPVTRPGSIPVRYHRVNAAGVSVRRGEGEASDLRAIFGNDERPRTIDP